LNDVPDFLAINAQFLVFSNLPMRNEEGDRPAYCPQCQTNASQLIVHSLAGAYPVTVISPRYKGDGIWICGTCHNQFQWDKTRIIIPTLLDCDLHEIEQKLNMKDA
jgi:hypothetical protein